MRTFLRRSASSFGFGAIASAAAALGTPLLLGACSSSSPSPSGAPLAGQTSFISAPAGGGGAGGAEGDFAAGSSSGGASNGAATPTAGLSGAQTTPTRTVQETDLYRLEGTRLYYLNSYRGLMVFDVSNVDQPKLLGRSPIYGDPVDMVVNQGIATVVVGNWYGLTDDGKPFHGSIVRGLDATDPANIKVLGDAKLGGWVQDDRVVGNVIYAVSQDEGWEYGWGVFAGDAVSGGVAIGPYGGSGTSVIVSSVNFAGGKVTPVSSKTYSGYGGVFNVTPNAILLAHPETPPETPNTYTPPSKTDLVYLDISDPGGAIVERSTLPVDGVVGTWGADNGRWNLDFADGKTAHVVGSPDGNYSPNGSYILATADFSNPDQPVLASSLAIPGTGWVPTARFDTGRMYLSPDTSYGYSSTTTPLEVFDLTAPAAPVLAGQTTLPGSASIMIPSGGNRLFVLGQDTSPSANSSQLSLSYLDVTDPKTPVVIGTSQFGEGWASTPAAGTFKAFTVDPTRLGANDGLVVLPFSGWDSGSNAYNDGVQLIEFTPSSIATSGAAHTHGWVERGIFVNDRIVSLSDLALSVVDYSNPQSPKVTAELTLARSVIASQPNGATIAQVSSDWWDNDTTHSDVRVLPTADAEEIKDESGAIDTQVDGVDARVFTNGTLDYIVTDVQVVVPCGANGGGIAVPVGAPDSPNGVTAPAKCTGWQQEVQVVDLANGGAKLRGKIALPMDPNGYYGGWGWYGCYVYDWYNGSDVVQVNGSTLAFRRWTPSYTSSGATTSPWVDASSDLFVVDLSNPDAPGVASTVITHDPTGWWGDMKVVGTTLYTTHEEWVDYGPNVQQWTARYYADRIDLSDIKHPKVGTKINVPGVLVGGTDDGSTLYTIDYRYDGANTRNDLDVVKVQGNLAYLQSSTPIDGYVGNVIVRGTTAYATAQIYADKQVSGQPIQDFHQIDLSNPSKPLDRIASGPSGWGWLLDVQGDRAMVTSGWGSDGLDVYKLSAGAAPVYDQFIRTRGWSVNSLTRQDNQLFLSSGYWGVEAVTLQ
jgi:hypothetical protein